MPHPLDVIAPASARDALLRVLTDHAPAIVRGWERDPLDPRASAPEALPHHTYVAALDACREIMGSGSQTALDAVFERAFIYGRALQPPSEMAARLNRVFSSLAVVAWPAVQDHYGRDTARQSQAVSLLLAVGHIATTSLYAVLERMMSTEVEVVQERQLRFFQEITRLATNNRLRLVDPHEIPSPEGRPFAIREPRDGALLRRTTIGVAASTEMAQERRDDLALAVGEAVSNVLKHAGQGIAHVWRREGAVFVFIADTGRGITLENLPKALSPGWSSEPSLGMGFTLMLEMVDTLWLSTSSFGTTVCVEKTIAPRTDPLLDILLREDRC